MIQRIQTLFLIAIAILMIVALAFPLVTFIDGESILKLTAFNLTNGEEIISNNFYISIPIVLVAIASIYSMLQFKNRLLQIKLGALISLLVVIATGLIFITKGEYANVKIDIGIWSLLASLICNFMSNWFIRRDDKLVRDSNRLR